MRYCALPPRILGVILCVLFPFSESAAQSYSLAPLPSWHLAGHFGLTMYNGTLDAENLDRSAVGYGLGGELAYQMNNLLGIGVGYDGLYHPRVSSPRFRHSLQGFFRLQHPYTRVAPYIKLGAQYTQGGGGGGGGPLVGFGLNLNTGGTYSLFQELTFNIVFPGDALDGTERTSSFDALGFFGVGLRITDIKGFFGKRNVTLGTLTMPNAITPDQDTPFMVDVAGNPPNTTYTWAFGDGTSEEGTTVRHAYEAPGLYPVTLTASNGGISKSEVRFVHVRLPVTRLEPTRSFAAPAVDLTVPLPKLPKLPLRPTKGYTWVIARYYSESAANAVAAAYDEGTQVVRIAPGTPAFEVYARETGTHANLTVYLVTKGEYRTLKEAAADRTTATSRRAVRPWILHTPFSTQPEEDH